MVVSNWSVMPKMAPTAKAPAATLSTASMVRVLLCHRSNQILRQMTLISGLRRPAVYVLMFVDVSRLMQDFARLFRLGQQLAELVVPNCQHFDRAALASPDGRATPALV